MTFGNWFCPFNRRQLFDATLTSLKTMRRVLSCDNAPFFLSAQMLAAPEVGIPEPSG